MMKDTNAIDQERQRRGAELAADLREWLIAQGFRVAYDSLSSEGNECNWYAYRRSAIPARECECNYGKPMQLVVRPWRIEHRDAPGGAWESAEVDVTGEAGSHWYKLQCYSLTHGELIGRLHEIEAALVAAWNALRPNVGGEPQIAAKQEMEDGTT